MAVDGFVFDKPNGYVKGDQIVVTFTDSTRAAIPAVPDSHEPLILSGLLGDGRIVNSDPLDIVTLGVPAVPAKPAGPVTATGGRTVALVAGSDTGTVAKYTTVA